jgi:outer membrane protein OmpA-like peptidoglycan-associated protein
MINHQDSSKNIHMKRFLLAIILVFSIQNINAQVQDSERAKRYFDRTYYTEAIQLYEKIVTDDASLEVVKNLADSYYYTNDFKNAQRYYRYLIKTFGKDLPEEYYFRFSQTLKATGSYAEANKVTKEYLVKAGKNDDIATLDKNLKTLENVTAIGERFKIKNLEINTPNSEFGAVKNGENLVFSGVKKEPSAFDKVYKWNNESYLNIVTIPVKNSNSKDSIVNYFSPDINTKMHEANAIFTPDGKTMYFTRNYTKNGKRAKNKEKISNLQIYKAEFVDGKWTNIVSLPFNSENYSTEHPALSPDGNTLYFASDMTGSKGSFDIYSVDIKNGTIGTPKNLGDNINTNRKEQFPFVSKDNKLYFSSNGHEGFGSLDVFVSDIKGNEYSKPVNVGLPVNTGVDDFAFNIDSDTKEGFFASNRKGGKGGDDIYSIIETKPLIVEDCKQYIAGIITDLKTTLPIDKAVVILQDVNKVEVGKVITTADGKFSFTVVCETGYTVLASKENYSNESKSFNLQKERNAINDASMALKSLEVIKAEELIAIAEKKKVADEIVAKEKVVAEKKKKEKVDNIVAKEKDVVKDDKDRLVIKTEPIYFDYDLWYIRRDSKVILDRVVELMNKYPDMIIEIGSHTDRRGGVTYNKVLSENRAQSTRDYLIDKGISEKRISAKGYGESMPNVKCESDDACTEEQHELNRRSEFVIKEL